MMDWQKIINKYYEGNDELRHILITHSRSVARKALQIASLHPELNLDRKFLEEAAMLHDIGIIRCDAPGIKCYGTEPYICHGTIGAGMLRAEGLEQHARVCERHTGTGLTLDDIVGRNLPLPHRDLQPETMEEQVICYADKFFSKTRLDSEKTMEQAERSLAKFGEAGIERLRYWATCFE